MSEERKSRYELFLEEEGKPQTKRCSKCGVVKAASEYWRRKQGRGMVSACKKCSKERTRKFRNSDDRFWKTFHSKTVKVGDCLEWTGFCNKVPMCGWRGASTTVRRVVYLLAIGDIPDDMLVVATCNNKRCVRHSHLALATNDDVNIIRVNNLPVGDKNGNYTKPERRAYGERNGAYTQPERRPHGQCHGNAKLTESDVISIRRLHKNEKLTYVELATRFNVSKSLISQVARYQIWKHVQ